MSLRAIPIMILPALAYLALSIGHGDSASMRASLDALLFSVQMISGGLWLVTVGQVLIAFSVICLFIEIVKSTTPNNTSLVENSLAVLVFAAMLAGFLLWPSFATTEFAMLAMMTAFDFMAGAVVMTMTSRRTVAMED